MGRVLDTFYKYPLMEAINLAFILGSMVWLVVMRDKLTNEVVTHIGLGGATFGQPIIHLITLIAMLAVYFETLRRESEYPPSRNVEGSASNRGMKKGMQSIYFYLRNIVIPAVILSVVYFIMRENGGEALLPSLLISTFSFFCLIVLAGRLLRNRRT